MGNVLSILKRDILRLLKAPAALIVVGALMVLPSLYTWYNVVAFWNPYEATGNLSVCVVNQDAGAETEITGKLNVGDKATEELLANDRLHFVEEEYDEAMADLKAGDVFAVYVIPEDFTECLISPLTGQLKSPQVVYYANEKLGPVSPKVTDTAASTLGQTVNSMFVATVSESAAGVIDSAMQDAKASGAAAQDKATAGVDAAMQAISDVRGKLKDAQGALDDAKAKTESAAYSLDEARSLVGDARTLVDDVSDEAFTVQEALASASSNTVDSLSGTASELSRVVLKAKNVSGNLLAETATVRARIDVGAGRVQPFIDVLSGTSQDLRNAAASLPDDNSAKAGIENAASALESRAAELQSAVDAATAIGAKIEEGAQRASDAAGNLDNASQRVSDALADYSGNLFGSAAPNITSVLAHVSSSCAMLSSAASDLETTIGEAQAGLKQIGSLLSNCNDALGQLDSLSGGVQSDIDTITTDIHLLSQSGTIADLVENGNLNAQNIGSFMGSPTKIETIQMYHPNAYGTAMAPLFMNLTFWIGAFMLVIIFRTEVDDEGIKKLTLGQRYLSRFILFAGIAIVQALICCAGVLALGVQVANVPALFLAAAMAALAYLSIIYALSTTLQHIGKALCIILVFAQIPGGSGLYPLELTGSFFQALYPFLPFSYGIDALREAIGGFYGSFFARDLAVLAGVFLGMIALGMGLGPLMSNVTRLAARQIREGDLYNGEDAVVPERPYRISQVINAFSDKEGFRESVERRSARFNKFYPVFIRVSVVLAVGVPAVLAFMLALDTGEKEVLLTIVLLWLIVLLVSVLVVESMRDSFERQLNLERMSGEKVSSLLLQRNRLVPALAGISQRAARFRKSSSLGEGAAGERDDAAQEERGGDADGSGEASGEASEQKPANADKQDDREVQDLVSDEASAEAADGASDDEGVDAATDDAMHTTETEGGSDA